MKAGRLSTTMAERTERRLPAGLTDSWERSTTDPDPLAALASSRDLAQGVRRWQATLVAEAVHHGTTWEQIGDTLGISRQAAWARFREVLEAKGGRSMEAETDELKRRIQEEVWALREAMKSIDESHRKARTEARDRLREVERQARQERKELRDRMKESIRSLQEEFRRLGSSA
jgi:hypothetical protein